MAATFPTSKKTFSQVVNGVTKLVAALFNTPYDEVEAIETMLGAMGDSQSYNESYKNLLINHHRGAQVKYKSTSDIYVTAGEIVFSNSNVRFRRNTSDLTVDWTNIDTGAEENSTTYYVWAVADSSATTFTVKISKSASLPAGATYYRLLGTFYNDGSGNITEIMSVLGDGRKTYDSGWFAASAGASYTKTHNVGTMRALVQVFVSDHNDGSGNCQLLGTSYVDANNGAAVVAFSTTTIALRTGAVNIHTSINSSGSALNLTSGYLRVVITAME